MDILRAEVGRRKKGPVAKRLIVYSRLTVGTGTQELRLYIKGTTADVIHVKKNVNLLSKQIFNGLFGDPVV